MVSGGITPTPTYDANGNQTSAIPATLTWNALNQPITVNSTTATYDALGRMVEKGVGTTYTQFVYNPDGTSLAVYSGGLTKGTISLPGGSTAVYNASGLNYIRHKDWLGSSRLATTWAHAVYAKEAYAPFGETYNEAGTPDRSFTGQDQNVVTNSGGTGVYDYLFRKYDPSAGRWLSPDPLGWGAVSPADPQSLDRYAYVENQPMNEIDPSGQAACLVSIGGMWFGYDSGNDPCAPGFKAYQTDPQTVTSNANSDSCSDSNPAACAPPSNLGGGSIPGGASGSGAGSGGGAPSNAANPPACQATLLNMANQQLGTNFNSSNVSGSYMNGTAYNIIIQSNQLTAAQFNNIQQGRYTTSGWQYLTGAGLAGHIADETNLGFAQSAFQSSNIGGNLSVSFAFHDDHGYANNPIGALIHWITDVLGHNTRKPC